MHSHDAFFLFPFPSFIHISFFSLDASTSNAIDHHAPFVHMSSYLLIYTWRMWLEPLVNSIITPLTTLFQPHNHSKPSTLLYWDWFLSSSREVSFYSSVQLATPVSVWPQLRVNTSPLMFSYSYSGTRGALALPCNKRPFSLGSTGSWTGKRLGPLSRWLYAALPR